MSWSAMPSTAAASGAHFDQYDVFLVQGLGRRRWQLGGLCDDETALLPHDDLTMLADFEPTDDWVLEPGDMLYVPPRFAHKGVAVGDDCMTYSVGFRAPSLGELVEGWTGAQLDGLRDDERYSDPDLSAQAERGEISVQALSRLHAMVTERLSDRAAFARWFAGHATTPKYAEVDWQAEHPIGADDIAQALSDDCVLIRNPASRFAFVRQGPGAILLSVDGQCYGLPTRLLLLRGTVHAPAPERRTRASEVAAGARTDRGIAEPGQHRVRAGRRSRLKPFCLCPIANRQAIE